MLFPVHVQESACIITGISYEGMDTSGKVNWAGLTNIHILKHEQAIRFQVRIRVFIYTCMHVCFVIQNKLCTSKLCICKWEFEVLKWITVLLYSRKNWWVVVWWSTHCNFQIWQYFLVANNIHVHVVIPYLTTKIRDPTTLPIFLPV